jgi:hypothetical protein
MVSLPDEEVAGPHRLPLIDVLAMIYQRIRGRECICTKWRGKITRWLVSASVTTAST